VIQHNITPGDSWRHFRGSVRFRPDAQPIQRRRSKDSGMIAFQLLFVKVLSEAPQLSYGNQTKQRSEFSLLSSVFISASTNVFGADLKKSKSLQMASKICFIPRQRLFFLGLFQQR
jgi:hypothetical protein